MIGYWDKNPPTPDEWRAQAAESDMRFRIAMCRHHPDRVPADQRVDFSARPPPPETPQPSEFMQRRLERREKTLALLESGKSTGVVARIMGVEKRTVKQMADRWGWELPNG